MITNEKKILDYAIVAFVDILGFSAMVKSDCEANDDKMKYFEVLKNLNGQVKEIQDCEITQFSDSVIFSIPLSPNNYLKLIDVVMNYQYRLLLKGIICRGAISFGKHYKENDFMFSQGLIEAYQLESKTAISPRIIVSKNLMELLETKDVGLHMLCKQRDGFYFLDYLSCGKVEETYAIMEKFSKNLNSYQSNVKEKYYWLFQYWEYKYSQKLPFNTYVFE